VGAAGVGSTSMRLVGMVLVSTTLAGLGATSPGLGSTITGLIGMVLASVTLSGLITTSPGLGLGETEVGLIGTGSVGMVLVSAIVICRLGVAATPLGQLDKPTVA
jgi:hypothetical protein